MLIIAIKPYTHGIKPEQVVHYKFRKDYKIGG